MMEVSVKISEGAPKVRLGELIHQRREKYNGLENLPIRGVSRDGFIMPKQKDADLSKYNVFYLNDFVFNPARMELNSITLNDEFDKAICSSLYEIFEVDTERVVPKFLDLIIKRDEFARQCEYIGSGSAREYCRVGNISEMEIPLPSIEVQREYVAVYKSLQQLAEQNEAMIKPLQSACNAFLIEVKKSYRSENLGQFIHQCDGRNNLYNLSVENVVGLSTSKELIPTKANMEGVSVSSYKLLRPNQFAYVADTSRRGDKISLGYNRTMNTYIVSSISTVFEPKDENILDSSYLYLWFCRPEFDRLARFHSWGSARETFVYSEMERVEIPIPPIEVQRSIVAIYRCAEEARSIAKEAREQLRKLAPAMVQRAANTPVEV